MTHCLPLKSPAHRSIQFVASEISAVAALIIVGLLNSPEILAQSQATARPEFEVASIKLVHPDGAVKTPNGYFLGGPRMKWSGGQLTMQNYSVRDIITEAYDLKDYQISGPKGLDSERYQIVAKAPPHTPDNQLRLMGQALLADRFKLEVHREKREAPAYALVVAKNGPKLRKPNELPKSKAGEPVVFKVGRGHISRPKLSMTELAELLTRRLGHPVSDMTGIKGTFAISLDWTPDESEADMFAGLPPKPGAPERGTSAQPNDSPSIFTAIQEQLGLKLESRKIPIEILIIDHVEKPSGN